MSRVRRQASISLLQGQPEPLHQGCVLRGPAPSRPSIIGRQVRLRDVGEVFDVSPSTVAPTVPFRTFGSGWQARQRPPRMLGHARIPRVTHGFTGTVRCGGVRYKCNEVRHPTAEAAVSRRHSDCQRPVLTGGCVSTRQCHIWQSTPPADQSSITEKLSVAASENPENTFWGFKILPPAVNRLRFQALKWLCSAGGVVMERAEPAADLAFVMWAVLSTVQRPRQGGGIEGFPVFPHHHHKRPMFNFPSTTMAMR